MIEIILPNCHNIHLFPASSVCLLDILYFRIVICFQQNM